MRREHDQGHQGRKGLMTDTDPADVPTDDEGTRHLGTRDKGHIRDLCTQVGVGAVVQSGSNVWNVR